MPPTRPPPGPIMVVTDEFRRELRAWIDKPGNNQSKLARAIGCHPSNISLLLNRPEQYKTSEWVKPIADYTGIAIPPQMDETEVEILEFLRQLRDTDPERYRALVTLIKPGSS